MADDLSNAINQLQQMLNSEDGSQKLSDMVSALGGMFGGNDKTAPPNTSPSSHESTPPSAGVGGSHDTSSDGINLEFLLKAKDMFGKMNHTKDDKALLLTALRPYLREDRRSKLDMIIKLASLAKMGSMIDDLKGLF